MATEGSTRVTIYSAWLWLDFSWWQNSQSIENNTTTIGWKMNLVSGNGTLQKSDRTWTVVIDGKTYTGKVRVNIGANSTQTLASGTAVISHNADGTKTFSYTFTQQFSLTLNNGNYMGTYSGSGSATLGTIARASQPSLVTWPETTNNVGNFGESFAIHMNRKSSSFTHTVRYTYGNRSDTIATGVETGTTWAVPLAFMNDIPNATSASGRIYVDTYNGTTKVGTKYTGFTVTVPSSVKPSCTITLEDTTGVDDIYGSPVQGLSEIKYTINPTTAYGSPIASYAVSLDGVNSTAASGTVGPLKKSGSSAVTATVKDKRGRSGSASYTMNVRAYTPPNISMLAVHRCNQDGTENDQGDYVRVSFNAAVTSLNSKNTATYTLRYKKSEATSYTSITLTSYANKYTVSGGSTIIPADSNSSYDIELTVADRHKSASRSTSASTAFTLMNWGAEGTSMALGKVAEEPGTFEVALDNYFYGTTRQVGNRYVVSSPGTAGSAGSVRIARVQFLADDNESPITFVITQQYTRYPTELYVSLEVSPEEGVDRFNLYYFGAAGFTAYQHRVSSRICDIYVRKRISSDEITIQDWYMQPALRDKVVVSFPGDQVSSPPGTLNVDYFAAKPRVDKAIIDAVYPVGSIYLSYNHTNPGALFGGVWVRIENAFLWATGATGTIGQTGGEREHTLTVNEMPAHSHGSVYSQHATGTKDKAWYTTTGSSLAYGAVPTGGGQAHNNMPPYIQVSVWRRTA